MHRVHCDFRAATTSGQPDRMHRAKRTLTDPKPAISLEEMQRRREHVRVAIADNRIEGIATDAATLAICEAYIRGEIEAADLVTAYLQGWSRRPEADRNQE